MNIATMEEMLQVTKQKDFLSLVETFQEAPAVAKRPSELDQLKLSTPVAAKASANSPPIATSSASDHAKYHEVEVLTTTPLKRPSHSEQKSQEVPDIETISPDPKRSKIDHTSIQSPPQSTSTHHHETQTSPQTRSSNPFLKNTSTRKSTSPLSALLASKTLKAHDSKNRDDTTNGTSSLCSAASVFSSIIQTKSSALTNNHTSPVSSTQAFVSPLANNSNNSAYDTSQSNSVRNTPSARAKQSLSNSDKKKPGGIMAFFAKHK